MFIIHYHLASTPELPKRIYRAGNEELETFMNGAIQEQLDGNPHAPIIDQFEYVG